VTTMKKLVELVTELPDSYSVRTCQPSDVSPCTQLVRAVDIAACGETTTTEEELDGDIFSPEVRRDESSVVITRNDSVVALLICFNSFSEGRDLFFDFFIHPDVEEETANQISISAVRAAEEFTRLHMSENNLDVTKCKTALYDADKAFIFALNDRGFEYHRSFWRMRRDMTDDLNVSVPSGYEIRDFRDVEDEWRSIHDVCTKAFADYYDYQPLSFDFWREIMANGINNPDLWRVVTHSGQMVAYLMGSHRFTSEGFGYVASIGVLREHRSQGIAKALLADAFNRDKGLGMQGTLLHGDSSNPTGAMKLYESVGMKTDRVYLGFRKEITKSQETD
jgi:ribosomal protein S18 acetylase RimI-like enzyme